MASNSHSHSLLRSMVLDGVIPQDSVHSAFNGLGHPFVDKNPETLSHHQQDATECLLKILFLFGSNWTSNFQGSYKSHPLAQWEPFLPLTLALPFTSTRNVFFTDLFRGTSVCDAPSCLLIALMRFQWRGYCKKNTVHVNVPEEFVLSLTENREAHYVLCAVVNHHGENAEAGHYTCACRRTSVEGKSKWWELNDQLMTECGTDCPVSGKECYMLLFEKPNNIGVLAGSCCDHASKEKATNEEKEDESSSDDDDDMSLSDWEETSDELETVASAACANSDWEENSHESKTVGSAPFANSDWEESSHELETVASAARVNSY